MLTNNDNLSLASSSNVEQPVDGVIQEKCAICGKFIVNSDEEVENGRQVSESDNDEPLSIPGKDFDINSKIKTTSYLMAVHRNLCRQDTYFLSHHKTRPGLFGVPLLIPCYDGVTNKELYCSVWAQVSRLLSKLPPTPPDQANHATDCDDSLGYDFPFTLKAVAEGGRVCCLCPWSKFCRGCEISCNDEPFLEGFLLRNGEHCQKSSQWT